MSPRAMQPPLLDVDPHARREGDFYPTPAWMTRALLDRLPSLEDAAIVEPCCGDGAIVGELLRAYPDADIVTNDLVARPPVVPDFLLDARSPQTWEAFRRSRGHGFDLVVTNPPFDVAFDIARAAYEATPHALVLLLRLSWLEPTEDRGAWLAAHPPAGVIVLPRHDFRGNGSTDSVTSAWVIWTTVSSDMFPVAPFDVVTRADRDRLIAEARQ